MAEILSGGLTWGSVQQAIVTMDKEGHPLTCCNPVTGECLGGGGSSDFSTAEVTVIFNKIGTGFGFPNINIPFADEYEGEKSASIIMTDAGDYNIILYGGFAHGTIQEAVGVTITNVAGTGGVTVSGSEGYYYIDIAGAGTLTIDFIVTGGGPA